MVNKNTLLLIGAGIVGLYFLGKGNGQSAITAINNNAETQTTATTPSPVSGGSTTSIQATPEQYAYYQRLLAKAQDPRASILPVKTWLSKLYDVSTSPWSGTYPGSWLSDYVDWQQGELTGEKLAAMMPAVTIAQELYNIQKQVHG